MSSPHYSSIVIDKYTNPATLDPFWKSRSWSPISGPTPAAQYVHSHRYIGHAVLHALQAVMLIPPTSDWLESNGKPPPALPEGDIKVLDACCGPAVVDALLYEFKPIHSTIEVLAIDRDAIMISEAQSKAEKGEWIGFEARQLDIANSGLPDETFSHILFNFAIMYFPDSAGILRELYRLLRPGGLIFFSSPISIHAITLVNQALSKISNPPRFPPGLPAFESNRVDSATDLLHRAGFEALSVKEIAYDASMMNAKMAAEATSPVVMNIGKDGPDDQRRDVMEAVRSGLEFQYGEHAVPYPQKVLVAVGRRPQLH